MRNARPASRRAAGMGWRALTSGSGAPSATMDPLATCSVAKARNGEKSMPNRGGRIPRKALR
jgi:hypothetical protein